jgi:hypothetical protein
LLAKWIAPDIRSDKRRAADLPKRMPPLHFRCTVDPNQAVLSGLRRSLRLSQNASKTGVFAGK